MGFSAVIKTMKDECINSGIVDENMFVSSIVQSTNLVNPAHIDVNDKTECISTWTESNIDTATDWYFILPNTTRDRSKAIVIRLRHGVTIKWDGRVLMHCSTIGTTGDSNNVYSTFFCSKK